MPKKKSAKAAVAAATATTPMKIKTRKIPEGSTVIELRSRHTVVPRGTATIDVANQVSLAIYGRRLNDCLGQAQGDVRVRDNEKNYIVVYLPVTRSSPEKTTSQSMRVYQQTVGYIRNMVTHASTRGIKIRIDEV